MGRCDNAPDEYCGFMLEPDDVGGARETDDDWHEDIRNAVCLREPEYDGLCIWHADTDEKDAEELVADRLKSTDLEKEGFDPSNGEWEPKHIREHLSGAILRGVEFPDRFSFGRCILVGTVFNEVDLRGAQFSKADLREAQFPKAYLREAQFPEADLRGAQFPEADLMRAEFVEAYLPGTQFRGAYLRGTQFQGAYLRWAQFSETDLRDAQFPEADLRGAQFLEIDLRGAEFPSAVVNPSEREEGPHTNPFGASLEDAEFGDGTDLRGADLSGARLYQTAFRDVRINDGTTFGWDDGNRYGETCRYDYDPNTGVSIDEDKSRLEAAVWTYRRLESLFEKNAMDERARNAHIRKQEAQRQRYREQASDGDSWRERLTSAGKYAVSTLNWHLHRHGESLRQLLLASAVLILICGGLYVNPWSGVARNNPEATYRITNFAEFTRPEAYIDLLNGLYFSVITFTTIGYGDFYPAGPLSRLLVGFESLAGALLIALFVFVIGRRVAR